MKVVDINTKRGENKHLVPKLKIDVTNYPLVSVTRPPYIDEEIDEKFVELSQLLKVAGAKNEFLENIYTFVEY